MENLSLDLAGIAALVLALVTLYTTLRNSKSDRTKTKINVVKELQDLAETATSKNTKLIERVCNLEAEFITMKGDLNQFLNLQTEWYEGIQLLVAQIRKNKQVPVWEPDLSNLEKLKEKYGSEQ